PVAKKDSNGQPITENGKTVWEPGKESWGGHSSIVVAVDKTGPRTISATTPTGTPAIKILPNKSYGDLIVRLARGGKAPQWGIQRIYVARTTYQVVAMS